MLSFVEIGPPVPEKEMFEGFSPYGHGSHLGHVTWIISVFIPSYRCFISNLALTGQAVSEKKTLNIMVIYMYIAPGGVRPAPWVQVFQNHKSSVYLAISFNFLSSNDILTLFPIHMHGPPMLTLL